MTDLTGWVTIDNQSGASYQNALLKLVAGDIHRVQPEMRMDYARPMAAAKEASPQFKEESFFEHHLYTLDRRTTIKDNQTKQMTLLDANQVPIQKLFIFSGHPQYYYSRYDQRSGKQKVGVFLELENTKKNNLGIPLPKGTIRVYKEDRDGSLQFVGEDRIDHTPKDENYFHTESYRNRLSPQCKQCKKETSAKYYTKNKQILNKKRSRYYNSTNGRKHNLKKCYGISVEFFNKMVMDQDGKCKICNKFPKVKAKAKKDRILHVDHCHDTGKIRGLLCSSCNLSLGGFKDSLEVLNSAVKYLKDFK